MEQIKYDNLREKMEAWTAQGKAFAFTINWESLDQPNVLKSWSGSSRDTTVDAFKEAYYKLTSIPNLAKIYVTVYSGPRGKTILDSETIIIRDNKNFFPIVNVQQPQQSQPQSNPQPQPQPQPAQQPQQGFGVMDMFFGFLGIDGDGAGLGSTNSPREVFKGMLDFRDNIRDTKYQILEKEKTVLQLQAQIDQLKKDNEQALSTIEELESENESLQGNIEELEQENEKLQKYIPENSPIGISLTALGSSVINNFAGKLIKRNPEAIAKILGTDGQTLMGLFGSDTPAQEPVQHQNSPDVEIEPVGNVSEQRKHELNAISQMTEWLKALDTENLQHVLSIFQIFDKDKNTIAQMLQWATGGRRKRSNVVETHLTE